jgi:pimeloyl-ACP methyl ester carboxylesterase
MKICFIHGANSSHASFAYIESNLGIAPADVIALEYRSENGFYNNLNEMITVLRKIGNEPIFFIAHSLGGIYALHLTEALRPHVIGAVTMSTPYGGIETGDWLRWLFPSHQLFKDVGRHSATIENSINIDIDDIDWTQLISSTGFAPHIPFKNDGVVTMRSMNFRADMTKIEVAANHYEIVLNNQAVDIIKDKLKKVYRSF